MLQYLELRYGRNFVEQFAMFLGEVDDERETPKGELAVLSCDLPNEDGSEGADGLEGNSRRTKGSLEQLEETPTVRQLIDGIPVFALSDQLLQFGVELLKVQAVFSDEQEYAGKGLDLQLGIVGELFNAMIGKYKRILQFGEYSLSQVVVNIMEQLSSDGRVAERADQQLLEALIRNALLLLKEFQRSCGILSSLKWGNLIISEETNVKDESLTVRLRSVKLSNAQVSKLVGHSSHYISLLDRRLTNF